MITTAVIQDGPERDYALERLREACGKRLNLIESDECYRYCILYNVDYGAIKVYKNATHVHISDFIDKVLSFI